LKKILLATTLILAGFAGSAAAMPCIKNVAERQCMKAAIYHEARGEPIEGQIAVALVIYNRTESGKFPNTICGVIKEPEQFTFVKNGDLPKMKDPEAAAVAEDVANVACAVHQLGLGEAVVGIDENVLWFQVSRTTPPWAPTWVGEIGRHNFFARYSPASE